MKVYNLTTRKVEEYNDGYAARLIEQGKAVPAQEKPAKAEEAPRDNRPKAEEAPKEKGKGK